MKKSIKSLLIVFMLITSIQVLTSCGDNSSPNPIINVNSEIRQQGAYYGREFKKLKNLELSGVYSPQDAASVGYDLVEKMGSYLSDKTYSEREVFYNSFMANADNFNDTERELYKELILY